MNDPTEWAKSMAVMVKDYVTKAIAPLVAKMVEIESRQPERGEKGDAGDKGVDGTHGVNGIDGKSISIDDVRPIVDSFLKSIPVPKDGTDGHDGKPGIDGKSFTIDDVRHFLEAEQAKWALEWERRAADRLEKAIDGLRQPQDGKDGKDGRDALNIEDMTVIHDGQRSITLRFARGEVVKEFQIVIPVVLDRGFHRDGNTYEKGDGVTHGGSYWIAQTETGDKPEMGNPSWRIAVKKGRDGKDGEKGDKGEPGKAIRFEDPR